MSNSLFDDMMSGAIVAKHLFRGATKMYSKTKQFAESEKGQQLKAELKAKADEAVQFANDKAQEMGLDEKAKQVFESASDKAKSMGIEAKAKYALEFAKEMIRNPNPYPELTPDIEVIVNGPGGYAERINALEEQITEETSRHRKALAELNEKLASAPEYIVLGEDSFDPENMPVTANVYEDMIQEEQNNYEATIFHMQRELEELKTELEEGLIMERQLRMEEEAYYEEQRRKEDDDLDWARFLGVDPDEYKKL